MRILLLFSGVLLLLSACSKPSRTIKPAFYYWQTSFRLSPQECYFLESLECRKLYIKFLDIARDPESGAIRPLSLLELADTSGLAGKQIVPCVFITNNVFQQISPAKIEWLAQKTAEALRSIGARFPRDMAAFGLGGKLQEGGGEVQFDCDWTASTRDAYFSFLRKIKTYLPANCTFSATIRLHQYKFPNATGVPPVERGMLMFYNTGDIDDPEEINSIFQEEDAQKYLTGAPDHYPLLLDLALPVFSWGLVYRDEELWKIIPGLRAAQLTDTALFAPVPGRVYLRAVKKGTFLSAHYLRPGDRIRLEEISPELLRTIALHADDADLAEDATVAFYHLDTSAVQQYPIPLLQTVWKRFYK